MNRVVLEGLDGADPLGFMAAIGLLRIMTKQDEAARLAWTQRASWIPVLEVSESLDPVQVVMTDLERWRAGHPAVDFAKGAERKFQDLKHPPSEFRALMRDLQQDPEAASFAASYATGVTVDGSGQTKPTSFHFTAGQQRFMDALLDLLATVTREDVEEALRGPWKGRKGKDLRWRAASERSRALLSYDPSSEKSVVVAGAVWLAFQSLPLFPVAPAGRRRLVTTCFTGRGHSERFTWAVWNAPLSLGEVRLALGIRAIETLSAAEREARGIVQAYRSEVVRSSQGYGNFSAAQVV